MRPLPSPLLVVTDRFGRRNPPSPTPVGPARPGHQDAESGQAQDPEGEGAERQALLTTIAAALDGGARWVWFRERDLEPAPRAALAREALRIVHAKGGVLTLGGEPGTAAAIGADGVHLPGGATADDVARARNLLPGPALVGVSAHGLGDVDDAARGGADYVTLSPIFPTASKPGYGPALGLDVFALAAAYGLPVIALGGIDPARARACAEAGASGIAVMGGIMAADDPRAATRSFLDALGTASAFWNDEPYRWEDGP